MIRAQALLAASLLCGVSLSAAAHAAPQHIAPQIAQATSDESLDAEYKQRIEAAKSPEEKDRLRTEYELRKRGGSIPDQIEPARPAPGAGGGDNMPKPGGGPQAEPPKIAR